MPTIVTTATAVPPYVMTQAQARQAVSQAFRLDPRRLALVTDLFDHAQVERRYTVFPLDYLVQQRSLGQTNQEYKEHAISLARAAAESCLHRAGVSAAEIDFLITVSCTGYMIPALDIYLINQLGFRRDVRRLPITELGCVAGASGLARAWDLLRGAPGANALVVAVELPSLTFQQGDYSLANMVACALFGDGAAAALVHGGAAHGARILDTQSLLIPDSHDAMGFDLRDSGFHMVLTRSVPGLLRAELGAPVDQLLARHGLSREHLAAFVLHPGGQKILVYLEEELGIDRRKTQPSWDVLREYGNLSSATILFVLHEWLTKHCPPMGAYGLAAGFGPGLNAELLLLQWV